MATYRKFPYGSFLPDYANGLAISNNATTPNTKLDVATGTILDSTGTFQIGLDEAVTINAATVGLNGIDTGALAASTVYAVYIVCDPVSLQPSGAMISLSYTQPYLPEGYGFFALIGFVTTNSSSQFLKGYWTAGNDTRRTFVYDAPIATAVTAGNATSFTAVTLTAFVPAVDNTPVSVAYAFTPGAASRTLNLTPANGVGNAVTITGQVTSVVISGNASVFSKLASGVPEIDYKVANSGDAVALNVAGYDFFI
jgi:hypothetical protein